MLVEYSRFGVRRQIGHELLWLHQKVQSRNERALFLKSIFFPLKSYAGLGKHLQKRKQVIIGQQIEEGEKKIPRYEDDMLRKNGIVPFRVKK